MDRNTDTMSDNPKFEVIDRRKFKAEEEERESREATVHEPEKAKPAPDAGGGPRLVANEGRGKAASAQAPQQPPSEEFPAPPSAEESDQQKAAYDASAQRIEDLLRAQNPGAGAPPPVTFDHLVQQLYVTAMLQMGAAAPEGEPPRIDIVGARASIDLLGVLAEKTKGNLTEQESRTLETILFDLRMAFLELSKVISLQGVHTPPASPGKR